jgi:hypothetical protein
MASLAASVAGALRRRGIEDPAAILTAEAGIAVFRVAFERWVDPANQQPLALCLRDSFDALRAVTSTP